MHIICTQTVNVLEEKTTEKQKHNFAHPLHSSSFSIHILVNALSVGCMIIKIISINTIDVSTLIAHVFKLQIPPK